MKQKSLVISTGFAMFSMFFGSGNLVFPLLVGKECTGHYLWAALGIILTGVLVPFLGAGAMMLYKGDHKAFFSSLGKWATFWLPFVILGLMGPFGVLARCITVAHGSFRLLFPDTSLALFSIGFCTLIFWVIFNKNRIVPVLGKYLTPFLLVALAAIGLFGYWYSTPPPFQDSSWPLALKNGIFQGYQTMDLLAAFFFSTIVIQHLHSHMKSEETTSFMPLFLKSALIGGGLLAGIYVLLVYLGHAYAPFLQNVAPQEMLGVVAQHALGALAYPIVCVAIVLACFTTAVVLASLFAGFLETEVAQTKLSHKVAIIITLAIAFCVSTLDFAGIARFIGPILEAIYPALIVLTAVNICSKLWGFKNSWWPVALAFVAKLCYF